MADPIDTPSRETTPDAAAAYAELATILYEHEQVDSVLRRVVMLATQTVPGTDAGSVTLLDGDRPQSRAFTGALALRLDEFQYDRNAGPCMDALQSAETIRIDDTSTDPLYEEFGRFAADEGVRASLSIGLPIATRVIGGINLYSRERPFDDAAVSVARSFAPFAAVALANAALFESKAGLAEQMQQALQSRAVIDQAKGILMAVHRCSADDAFARLVAMSQQQHRKLRLVAEDIVEKTVQPD